MGTANTSIHETGATCRAGKVSGQRLLEIIFPDEASRPTLRFLRSLQARRLIPYYKIGRRVFFDVEEAQEAFSDKMRVNARWEGGR